MTGQEFFRDFQVRIEKSYSRFVDAVKAERLFKRALVSMFDQKWASLDSQKEYDELRSILSSETVVTPRSNNIQLSPLLITNLTNSGNVVTIKTLSKHGLIFNDQITISDVQGIVSVPSINGTHSVTSIISEYEFEIQFSTILGSYVADSGNVTHSAMLPDYLHLFAISCKFEDSEGYSIASVANRTPVVITLSKYSPIRSYDQVTISGHTQTILNGTFYVKHHTDKRYSLYYDEFLEVPVVGAVNSSNESGILKKVFYRYADMVPPDMKISVLAKPDVSSPAFEISSNGISIFPNNRPCLEAKVDYMSLAKRFIDPTDNVLNLELVYPVKFLYRVLSEAVALYASPTRDQQLEASERRETQINP